MPPGDHSSSTGTPHHQSPREPVLPSAGRRRGPYIDVVSPWADTIIIMWTSIPTLWPTFQGQLFLLNGLTRQFLEDYLLTKRFGCFYVAKYLQPLAKLPHKHLGKLKHQNVFPSPPETVGMGGWRQAGLPYEVAPLSYGPVRGVTTVNVEKRWILNLLSSNRTCSGLFLFLQKSVPPGGVAPS